MTRKNPPYDEPTRLRALRDTGLSGSGPVECFDRITRLAATYFSTPWAMLNLVGERSLENKSLFGLLPTPLDKTDSFCSACIALGSSLVVADAHAYPRFSKSEWVVENPWVRFYAGTPLCSPSGDAIGALSILAPEPRLFNENDAKILLDFSSLAEAEIERVCFAKERTSLASIAKNAKLLAATDELTRIWNRPAIVEILRSELSRALRGEATTVACIGIDGMLAINQAHGLSAGDATLSGVASCIRHCIRDFDMVGRDEGDRFILVLSNCSKEQAKTVCERVRQFISKQNFMANSGAVRTAVSIGVATSASGPLSLDRVVAAAERCLFISKTNGRNRVSIDPALY